MPPSGVQLPLNLTLEDITLFQELSDNIAHLDEAISTLKAYMVHISDPDLYSVGVQG